MKDFVDAAAVVALPYQGGIGFLMIDLTLSSCRRLTAGSCFGIAERWL